MSPRDTKAIHGALTAKGFVHDPSGDHQAFHLYVGKKKMHINTHYSHSAKQCGDRILGLMARQLRLTGPLLRELIDCTLTGEGYIEILRGSGHIKE
jgi:hypothetical protein